MKTQKFYPRQVIRRLVGEHKQLTEGQMAVIKYAGRKGRKLGLVLSVGSTASAAALAGAESPYIAHAILQNASTFVFLKE